MVPTSAVFPFRATRAAACWGREACCWSLPTPIALRQCSAASGFCENLLGSPPPLPPPNVPPLKESSRTGAGHVGPRAHGATPRESRLRGMPQDHGPHRARARKFRWGRPMARHRIRDLRSMPSGQLVDGTKVDGPASLRQALARSSRGFRRHHDREIADVRGRAAKRNYYDMPVVRAVMRGCGRRSLPVFRAGFGNRAERSVSDENERSA